TFDVTLMRLGAATGTDMMAVYRSILAADVHVKQQYDQMMHELRALPGVVDVGIGSTPPLEASQLWPIKIEGRAAAVGAAMSMADWRTADPAYFRAAGIPLVAGREFGATDRLGGARVLVVNRTFVERYFPNVDP